MTLKQLFRAILNRAGIDVYRRKPPVASDAKIAAKYEWDYTDVDTRLIEMIQPFTMTPPARLMATRAAVKYVVINGLKGAIVECGVWRGGNIMMALHTLMELGDTSREIWLYDTFEGMTPPSSIDTSIGGQAAADLLNQTKKTPGKNVWCIADLTDVQHNLSKTGYPQAHIHYVKGDVLTTLPASIPEQVAFLRLDTDWHASTRHELIHLYPRLTQHGVLIVDDYGHWRGQKEAVDEYFQTSGVKPLLHRVDYSCRSAIKI